MQQRKKTVGSTRSNPSNEVENLVQFKRFKDQGDEKALAIFSAFEKDGNETVFHIQISEFLRAKSARNAAPVPASVPAPVPTPAPVPSQSKAERAPVAALPPKQDMAPVRADNKYRTVECQYWATNGSCRNGDNCRFKHSAAAEHIPNAGRPSNLPSVKPTAEAGGSSLDVSNDNMSSSQLCRSFSRDGKCRKGSQCPFMHQQQSSTSALASASNNSTKVYVVASEAILTASDSRKSEVDAQDSRDSSATTASQPAATSAVAMTNLLKSFVGLKVTQDSSPPQLVSANTAMSGEVEEKVEQVQVAAPSREIPESRISNSNPRNATRTKQRKEAKSAGGALPITIDNSSASPVESEEKSSAVGGGAALPSEQSVISPTSSQSRLLSLLHGLEVRRATNVGTVSELSDSSVPDKLNSLAPQGSASITSNAGSTAQMSNEPELHYNESAADATGDHSAGLPPGLGLEPLAIVSNRSSSPLPVSIVPSGPNEVSTLTSHGVLLSENPKPVSSGFDENLLGGSIDIDKVHKVEAQLNIQVQSDLVPIASVVSSEATTSAPYPLPPVQPNSSRETEIPNSTGQGLLSGSTIPSIQDGFGTLFPPLGSLAPHMLQQQQQTWPNLYSEFGAPSGFILPGPPMPPQLLPGVYGQHLQHSAQNIQPGYYPMSFDGSAQHGAYPIGMGVNMNMGGIGTGADGYGGYNPSQSMFPYSAQFHQQQPYPQVPPQHWHMGAPSFGHFPDPSIPPFMQPPLPRGNLAQGPDLYRSFGAPLMASMPQASSRRTVSNQSLASLASGESSQEPAAVTSTTNAILESSTSNIDNSSGRTRLQSLDSELSFNHDSIVNAALDRASFDLTSPLGDRYSPAPLSTPDPNSLKIDGPSGSSDSQPTSSSPVPTAAVTQGAAAANATKFARTTKNQPGLLTVYFSRGSNGGNRREGQGDIKCQSENFSVRPGGHLNVEWQLPAAVFENPKAENLVIGILRFGSIGNQPAVVTKSLGPLGRSTKKSTDVFGNSIVSGSLPFHAPKGSGRFIFRLFDCATHNKPAIAVTLATSLSFSVELVDIDVTSNLRFSLDTFNENHEARAIQQLVCTIMCIRNSGRPMRGDDPAGILSKNVIAVLQIVQDTVGKLDAGKARAAAEKMRKAAESAGSSEANLDESITMDGGSGELGKSTEDEAYWSAFRVASRLQGDLFDVLKEIMNNRIVWNMLSPALKEAVQLRVELFCPVLHRFFDSMPAVLAARCTEFGFALSGPSVLLAVQLAALPEPVPRLTSERSQALKYLDQLLHERIPSLYPSPSLQQDREQVRERLEQMIIGSGIVPSNAKLHLYGSSCNNFGVDTADMDMCLALPSGYSLTPELKPHFLESLGQALRTCGMEEVEVRATARIPIINFKDPASGLDCDISFYNPLALRNTQLLRSYSLCDERVRPLVYIIKHWAKCRQINSPSDGTLGSYGYILCLIHYLQRTRFPVVPNLQRIPLVWNGEPLRDDPELLGHDIELHPVCNTPCKTYFYDVNEKNAALIRREFGGRNREWFCQILAGFFQYYAWGFDFRHHIVSINSPLQSLSQQKIPTSKLCKAESDGWTQHDRLSIEDPFEVWYDVAHVIKGQQMALIRKEFLRAHTILNRFMNCESLSVIPSSLPTLDQTSVLDLLFEVADRPAFARKDRADSVAVDQGEAL